jgi:hypothetical protein
MKVKILTICFVLLSTVLISTTSHAVDGTVLIDQARALAGNVTTGDTPGFPVTISKTGSYKLSGNLTVPNENTTAISITADSVTLDLNGFSITGVTYCSDIPLDCTPSGTGVGIYALVGRQITVMNGSVKGMGSSGIVIGDGRIESVQASNNRIHGIHLSSGLIINCIAEYNGNTGIHVGTGTVRNCYAYRNHESGILLDGNAIENTSIGNYGHGLYIPNSGGYSNNVLTDNNSGGAQVRKGADVVQLGDNYCEDELCP